MTPARLQRILDFTAELQFVRPIDIELAPEQAIDIPKGAKLIYERADTHTKVWKHEGIVYKTCNEAKSQKLFRARSRQEALIPRRLAPLAMGGVTPHICLPVAWKRMGDGASLLILEAADTTLNHVLQDVNVPEYVVFRLLYQTVWTLHVIRQMWPGFVHGDLHASNVFVRVENVGQTAYASVTGSEATGFTKLKYHALIADFYYSEVKSTRHACFDWIFLFDSLLGVLMSREKCRVKRRTLFELLQVLVPDACRYRSCTLGKRERGRLRSLVKYVDKDYTLPNVLDMLRKHARPTKAVSSAKTITFSGVIPY
jgi:hypothetical protein